ncbi:MAG TPA: hypothetical protein DCG53_00395 [Syntrophus sp. (in: bacteria)]|jgi:hypothetical protein|nr:hypothetical protein [Syntrophus sp. (in: bacteria)]
MASGETTSGSRRFFFLWEPVHVRENPTSLAADFRQGVGRETSAHNYPVQEEKAMFPHAILRSHQAKKATSDPSENIVTSLQIAVKNNLLDFLSI